jgi:hypothetical protein
MPGARQQQVPKWERMEAGDHIFFAGGGVVFADAVVTVKLRNPLLAESLWGTGMTGNGLVQTWELMFAIDEVTPIEIPIPNLNAVIGRSSNANVQEFVVLDPRQSEAAVALLPPAGQPRRGLESSVSPAAVEVDIEARNVDAYVTQRSDASALALRREGELVRDYVEWLADRGEVTVRHRIRLPEGGQLFTDVFNVSTQELLEAKAAASRGSVRMGLGQLLDYCRFVTHQKRALLLPGRPLPDLMDLLHAQGVSVVWSGDATFYRSNAPGTSTGN